jgi:hypothetical protein
LKLILDVNAAAPVLGGRAADQAVHASIIEPDVVEALQALREKLEELFQIIFVADWTGFCTKHKHRIPWDAVDGYINSTIGTAIHLAQILKDHRGQFFGRFFALSVADLSSSDPAEKDLSKGESNAFRIGFRFFLPAGNSRARFVGTRSFTNRAPHDV